MNDHAIIRHDYGTVHGRGLRDAAGSSRPARITYGFLVIPPRCIGRLVLDVDHQFGVSRGNEIPRRLLVDVIHAPDGAVAVLPQVAAVHEGRWRKTNQTNVHCSCK